MSSCLSEKAERVVRMCSNSRSKTWYSCVLLQKASITGKWTALSSNLVYSHLSNIAYATLSTTYSAMRKYHNQITIWQMFAVQTTSENTRCVLLLLLFETVRTKWHERRAEIKVEHGLGHVFVLLRSSLVKIKSLLGFRWGRKRSWAVACGRKDWWEEADLATPWRNTHLYACMWLSRPFLRGLHTSGYRYLSFSTQYLLSHRTLGCSAISKNSGEMHMSAPLCRSFQNVHEQAFMSFVFLFLPEKAWLIPTFVMFKMYLSAAKAETVRKALTGTTWFCWARWMDTKKWKETGYSASRWGLKIQKLTVVCFSSSLLQYFSLE